MEQLVKLKIQPNKNIKVICCLPGSNYSREFLINWSEFLMESLNSNISIIISQQYDPVIYYVRNKCLGGDVLRGIHQKPFDGKLDYDFLMWIDSDIMFDFKSFKKLLDHNLNIVSGIYLVEGGRNFASVINWDTDFFLKHGYFKFLTQEDIKGKTGLIEVAYTGFGFILIKRGVFESLEYPWFQPVFQKLKDNIQDFSSEDASFCELARKNGFKIYVDPTVRVGHKKSFIY